MAKKYTSVNRIGQKRGSYKTKKILGESCDTKQKLLNYWDNQTDPNKATGRLRVNRILSKQFINTNNNRFLKYINSNPTSLKLPNSDQIYKAMIKNYNDLRLEIRAEIPFNTDYCKIKDIRNSGEIERLENLLLNSIRMTPRSDIVDAFNEVSRGALSTIGGHKTRSTYTSRENTRIKDYILEALKSLQDDTQAEYYSINT